MQYIQVIYNPMAGKREFANHLDYFLKLYQNQGYDVRIHRTNNVDDFANFFMNRDMSGCAAVMVAGGDGSINRVVNAMAKEGLRIPLGIIPAGTANDFAANIGMPTDLHKAIEALATLEVGYVDYAKINDAYFVNTCCGGLFSKVSQGVDIELKNTLGKLAYYIKGVQQLPTFNNIKLKITNDNGTIDNDFSFFLVLNGSTAAGLSHVCEGAKINDGKMDFIGIKACHITDVTKIFAKFLLGEHLTDKNVVFFQSDHITIECVDGPKGYEETDMDGEKGPMYPLKIEVLKQQLPIVMPIM